MFKTILFPVDQSRESWQAAEVVVDLVKFHQSRLVILSVVESVEPVDPIAGAESAPDSKATEAAVAELLRNAQAMFGQQGITAQTIERSGKPAFAICDVADEVEASLIVMGSRGLGLTEEGAAESVTTRVISLSPCPVLIVP